MVRFATHRTLQAAAVSGVVPDEVDEVCFGRAFVLRAQSQGDNPVYYILGQTEVGRYL